MIYSGLYYGGLYQNVESVLYGEIFYFLTIIVIFFYHFFNNKKRNSLTVIVISYLILSVWTIIFSPQPRVDVFVNLKEAPQKLLAGKNPYSENYTKVYSNVKPDYFNYLPFSFLYLLPFVYFLGDPRYGSIFANLIIALVLKKIVGKDKDNMRDLFIMTFLFLPRSFYILEHMYLDVIIFTFYLLFFFLYSQKNNKNWAFLFLGLFFNFKQHLLFLFPYFLQKIKVIFSKKNFFFFLLPFGSSLIFLLINSHDFLKNILTIFNPFFNPSKIPSPIEGSLSIPTFLKMIIPGYRSATYYLFGIILFMFSYILLLLTRQSLITKVIVSLFFFQLFIYHSFFNHYYFVALFLLLDIYLDYFKIKHV